MAIHRGVITDYRNDYIQQKARRFVWEHLHVCVENNEKNEHKCWESKLFFSGSIYVEIHLKVNMIQMISG